MEFTPVTTAESAATIYHEVLSDLVGRFRADDVPHFRLGSGTIRGIVVSGLFGSIKHRRAWLKILLDPEAFDEPDFMRRFNWNTSSGVRAPRIRLRGETNTGYPFFVSEDVADHHIIDPKTYAGNPLTSWRTKTVVSETHWEAILAYLSATALPKSGPAPEIWFDDRIVEWLSRAEENGAIAKRFLAPPTLVSAIETLRRASEDMPAPGTYFSQAYFENSKVLLETNKVVFLNWSLTDFVPLMHDAANWVADATLNSWNVSTKDWLLETKDYEDAFCGRDRTILGRSYSEDVLRHAYRACLLERLLHALLVVCAEGESINQSLRRRQAIIKNTRATLLLML